MSRVSTIQKYAILWLNSTGLDAVSISEEVKVTETQVKNVLKKNLPDNPVSTNPVATNSVKKTTSKDLMITESTSGRNKVAIMTKAASEMNDESKKTNNAKLSELAKPYIYRPYNG